MKEFEKYQAVYEIYMSQIEELLERDLELRHEFTDVSILPGGIFLLGGKEITREEYNNLFEIWSTERK
jgi:hypothetical protein